MPSAIRIFNGKMNKDIHPFRMKPEDYQDALNITKDAQGESLDGPPSNIVGNTLISYAGISSPLFKTIGQFPDKVRNRVYYFVWAANGHNLILFFDKTLNVVTKVLEDIADTGGVGILNFNPSWHINHIDIVYRDQGDLLFWTDGLNPPSKINVATALAGGYGVVQRSYINVAKEPPAIPPAVTFEDDATITVNNLRKRLWKFKYRYVFDDLEKSVWSSQSEIPLPTNYTDTAVDKDPTKNARIALVVQTGRPNVKKIEIAAAQSLGTVFSDFFLINVIDKSTGVPDNDITSYRFFNDKAYNFVDITESILDADWVPQKAYAQSLPNGDVLTYGAITEGYNLITLAGSAVSTLIGERQTQFPFIFVSSQSGDSGFGSGNIHIIVIGSVVVGSIFNIYTTNQTVSFTAVSTSSAAMITGLSAAAVAAGFAVVSSDTENLVIVKTGESLQRSLATNVIAFVTDTFAYNWYSRYTFGVLYRDFEGRQVGGVITLPAWAIQTIIYTEIIGIPAIPLINLAITSRPPVDAVYFNLVRTQNLTMSNWIEWVSDRTFKDTDFAYISIESLTTFIIDNPTTILSYSFVPGDRIRFIKMLSNGQNTIYASEDFEIQSQVQDPLINGAVQSGKFIKIALPTTDATFDFGVQTHAPFPNPLNYNNYLIQLYTPALSVANGLDAFYEFGERYDIAQPGTDNRCHQGQTQNQPQNLSVPATFSLDKGDAYYRHRTINTGVEFVYLVTAGSGPDSNAGQITLGLTLQSQSFNDPNILTGNSPYNNLIGFNLATNNDRWILKIVTGTFTFRIKGSIIITFADDRPGDQYRFALQDNTGVATYLTPIFDSSKAGTYTFVVDTTFTLSTGERIFIFGISQPNFDHTRSFTSTTLTITRQQVYNVAITDPNFSDFFNSKVNSDGRASVVDPNSLQTYFPTMVRFGGEYQQASNVNQINRFQFDNQDTYDRSFGDIRKLFIEGRYMYVFQKFEVGVLPILTQIIKDVTGNPLEANSDQLLNKIAYPYKGKFGIGDCPESFAYGKFAKYFFDNNKGVVCRLSQDGIIALSVLYEMNAFFVPKGPSFRKELNNGVAAPGQTYTGDPTVYGVFDSFTNKYIIALEQINRYNLAGQLVFHQDAETAAFLETRNASEGFESLYSYHPEMMASLDNLLITWTQGTLWRHDSGVTCNFYGVQYTPSITGVFNDHMRQKKTWESVAEDADVIWECTAITTQLAPNQVTQQQSTLVAAEFKFLEGEYSADLKRDLNSVGGKINGSTLKGKYIIIKFEAPAASASSPIFLNAASIFYLDSPETK